MKKTYVKPVMEIQQVELAQMVAVSKTVTPVRPGGGGHNGAKETFEWGNIWTSSAEDSHRGLWDD